MPFAVLEATDVEKIYPGPVRALDGANLTVEAGETMVLVGESGSGKSTLLRMFNRMADPSSGRIRIRARDAADWDPIELRRSVGYVQQEGGLLPHWKVAGNVALVPRLLKWTRDRQERQVNALLDLVGMDAPRFRDRYPSELSGGQRQRVAFARALAADPDVLLMDEPFGALDAITRVELHGEFLRLKTRLRKTMLLVTHDLTEAFRLGDRIAVMKEGRILQIGSPAELEAAPAHDYVNKLLRHAREESQ